MPHLRPEAADRSFEDWDACPTAGACECPFLPRMNVPLTFLMDGQRGCGSGGGGQGSELAEAGGEGATGGVQRHRVQGGPPAPATPNVPPEAMLSILPRMEEEERGPGGGGVQGTCHTHHSPEDTHAAPPLPHTLAPGVRRGRVGERRRGKKGGEKRGGTGRQREREGAKVGEGGRPWTALVHGGSAPVAAGGPGGGGEEEEGGGESRRGPNSPPPTPEGVHSATVHLRAAAREGRPGEGGVAHGVRSSECGPQATQDPRYLGAACSVQSFGSGGGGGGIGLSELCGDVASQMEPAPPTNGAERRPWGRGCKGNVGQQQSGAMCTAAAAGIQRNRRKGDNIGGRHGTRKRG